MEKLLDIFNQNKLDITAIENLLKLNVNGLTDGMSQFQINHFVLNKQEFPTPYAQFLQARHEIYLRINTFIDLYFQHRECLAKVQLAEGRMEKIKNEETYPKLKRAKLELQEIEIEKNGLRLASIQTQAEDKVREMQVFYEKYKEHRHFETDPPEEIQAAEEEYWKIKSGYYPELRDRYGLTPAGFLELPHENGGVNKLIELMLEGGNTNAKTIHTNRT